MGSLGQEMIENPHEYWEEMKIKENDLTKQTNEILRKNGFTPISLPSKFLEP